MVNNPKTTHGVMLGPGRDSCLTLPTDYRVSSADEKGGVYGGLVAQPRWNREQQAARHIKSRAAREDSMRRSNKTIKRTVCVTAS